VEAQKLPIKMKLDLSDEKLQKLFIYRQKYNMKKNDFFNLERRKSEIEKEAQVKDKEIERLREINRKLKQQESQENNEFSKTYSVENLVKLHNQQINYLNN